MNLAWEESTAILSTGLLPSLVQVSYRFTAKRNAFHRERRRQGLETFAYEPKLKPSSFPQSGNLAAPMRYRVPACAGMTPQDFGPTQRLCGAPPARGRRCFMDGFAQYQAQFQRTRTTMKSTTAATVSITKRLVTNFHYSARRKSSKRCEQLRNQGRSISIRLLFATRTATAICRALKFC
jgi:hypothetical protein